MQDISCFRSPQDRQETGNILYPSWLNIAEIELNAMTRQCLSRKITEIVLLRKRTASMKN